MKNNAARTAFTLAFAGAGIAHFLTPKLFIALIPQLVPWRRFWVYISGAIEIVVAVGLTVRPWRQTAANGVLTLLLLFTPLHVIDIFRRQPVTGNKPVAILRLFGQFLLIRLALDLAREP